MGRMYRILAEDVVVGQPDVGDLLVIQGAPNIVSVVHGYRITQREESLSQQLRLRVIRRSSAPLGTPATVTPARQFPGDAAAHVTVFRGLIAAEDVGTEVGAIDSDNQSLPNGWVAIPTPETRAMIIGAEDYLALNLPTAHGQTGNITFDVVVDLEEIG